MSERKRLSTEQRRHNILTAARGHFAEHVYSEASLPSIASDSESSQSLIYHYFSSKAGLHAAAVQLSLEEQRARRAAAVDALEDGQPVHYRMEILLLTHLDGLLADPLVRAGTAEPQETLVIRREAEQQLSQEIAAVLGVGNDFARHRWAVTGIIGFLHRAADIWAREGAPADQRRPLIEATLGALQGALGDWRV